MTITFSDLQKEKQIRNLKDQIVQNFINRDGYNANIQRDLKLLAELMEMEVCGEALVEKSHA